MDDPLNLMRVMPTQGVSEPDWPLRRAHSVARLYFLTTKDTNEHEEWSERGEPHRR
jgi:hypothetical protein